MFPPLNPTLSPYTGWTRDHWVYLLARITYGYVLAADKQGTMARALYADDRREYHNDSSDGLESFARIASGWGAYLANPQNPEVVAFEGRELNIAEILSRALIEGSDKSNPHTYWGEPYALDQRIVESADMALAIWFSRERVFNRMSKTQQDQVMAWLALVDGQDTYYDNWVLFPAVAQAVRLQMGYPVDESELDERIEQMAAFYRGDGWYVDGPGAEYELYNAWMFGWHFVLWAHIDGARRPEMRDLVLNRHRSFLSTFQHFFGANGSYPAWGRSIVYRFAAVACFATGHLTGSAPIAPGVLRRICSGNIKYFYDNGAVDPVSHHLLQGYHGNFPAASEAYISPGSPSWACHGLFGLNFSHDDPFWTATEEPLPVERGDFEVVIPTPGYVLSGHQATGQVFLLNAGTGHYPENLRHNYLPKYGKLAYSTHFPFNVLPAGRTYAPDAMVAVTNDDKHFGHRYLIRSFGTAPGFIWTEFFEELDVDVVWMKVAILMWREVQLRFTFLQPTRKARTVEAPGALGCSGAAVVTRRSNQPEGWEYASAQERGSDEVRALAIKRLVGYEEQRPSAPFLDYANINLAYPYAEQPLVMESAHSFRIRSLVSASLLRPAAFDPAQEFAGIDVTLKGRGEYEVKLPNDERAYISLANELCTQIQIGGDTLTGDAIRFARVSAGHVVTDGVTNFPGVFELNTAGIVELARENENTVRVLTNTGIKVSEQFLGGMSQCIQGRALDGTWVDLDGRTLNNIIPNSVVKEWTKRNERTLVEFRLTR